LFKKKLPSNRSTLFLPFFTPQISNYCFKGRSRVSHQKRCWTLRRLGGLWKLSAFNACVPSVR